MELCKSCLWYVGRYLYYILGSTSVYLCRSIQFFFFFYDNISCTAMQENEAQYSSAILCSHVKFLTIPPCSIGAGLAGFLVALVSTGSTSVPLI